MNYRIQHLVGLTAAMAILLVTLIMGCEWMLGFDRRMHARVRRLEMGTELAEVKALLGEPVRESDACCLPQRHGFEQEFQQAEESTAVRYFLWRNGINWYYCMGFDPDDKLVVNVEGHS